MVWGWKWGIECHGVFKGMTFDTRLLIEGERDVQSTSLRVFLWFRIANDKRNWWLGQSLKYNLVFKLPHDSI
jgi:hypothetical protein